VNPETLAFRTVPSVPCKGEREIQCAGREEKVRTSYTCDLLILTSAMVLGPVQFLLNRCSLGGGIRDV